jgi:hypothetical protein
MRGADLQRENEHRQVGQIANQVVVEEYVIRDIQELGHGWDAA